MFELLKALLVGSFNFQPEAADVFFMCRLFFFPGVNRNMFNGGLAEMTSFTLIFCQNWNSYLKFM